MKRFLLKLHDDSIFFAFILFSGSFVGGTDVNWTTHEGESALLLACKRRQGTEAEEFVNLLLQHGADPNILDNEEDSPLLEGIKFHY